MDRSPQQPEVWHFISGQERSPRKEMQGQTSYGMIPMGKYSTMELYDWTELYFSCYQGTTVHALVTSQWSVSNQQQLDWLINVQVNNKREHQSSILLALCERTPSVTGSQRTSNEESVSMSWRHHNMWAFPCHDVIITCELVTLVLLQTFHP